MTDIRRIITFSGHSLDLFSCMRKYNYTNILRKGDLTKNDKLEKGDLTHTLLEIYYKTIMDGGDKSTAMQEAVEVGRKHSLTLDLPIEQCEFVIQRFRDYVGYYASEQWQPIAVEEPFSKPFYEDDQKVILAEGRVDLVVSNEGRIIPVDHKSESRRYEQSILSNQFFILAWAFDSDIVIRNGFGLQKAGNSASWFHRQVLSYDRKVIEDWRKWTINHVLLADARIQDGVFPPDFTQCFRCDFKRVCSVSPETREWTLETQFINRPKHDLFGENNE